MKRVGWIITLLGVVMLAPTLLAQGIAQGAQAVAGAAVSEGTTSEWGSGVVWAFLSASLLEWMKRSQRIAFVSDRMAWGMQRLLGIGLAVATAAGVHVSFEAQAGVLTVSGLLWPSIQDALGESLRQWVFNELTYRVAVKNYGKDE